MILQVAYLSTGSLTLPAPPPACRLNVRWLFCRQTLGAESRAYPHTIVCGDDHRAFDCLGAKRDHRRGFVPMRPPRGSWAIPCLRPRRPSYSALAKASHLLSSSWLPELDTATDRAQRRRRRSDLAFAVVRTHIEDMAAANYRMMLTRAGKYCVERTRPGEPASKNPTLPRKAQPTTGSSEIKNGKQRLPSGAMWPPSILLGG